MLLAILHSYRYLPKQKVNKMNKILITGAAGQMGGIVIDTLLKKITPQQINALTRKEEKRLELEAKGLNAFLGSYDDIPSLEKAMEGVDTVLLISAGSEGDRMQQHKNVVDTAKKMGVQNIAYTSRSLKDRATLVNKMMVEHFQTEDYIKASGLKYILFKNALYMETLVYYVGKNVFEKGEFAQVAGDGRTAFTLRKDQSEAMANVLLTEDFNNQIYNFTNSETYSMYDVATALTELSGKKIVYSPMDLSTYQTTKAAEGTPPFMVKIFVNFNLDIQNGQETVVSDDLENKLGRKPTSLKDGLKELFKL